MAFVLKDQSLSYNEISVLEEISLHIKQGEKVALLGKSGSGKSTLLKHLFEVSPDESAYIPQELGLVESLSVFHNVYIANLDKHSIFYNFRNLFLPIEKEKEHIQEVLQTLEMQEFMFKPSKELSGGQKQRTAIARALFCHKPILLADEPISALDEYLSKKTLNTICSHFQTIVCALHNVGVALEYFDRVIGLKEGKIILDKMCQEITPEDTQQLYHACNV